MKKVLIMLLLVVLSGMFIVSCKSSKKCSAYGETTKFQKERRR